MRNAQWLFLVSAGLFIGAIVFLIAAARSPRAQEPSAQTALAPVASIKQIMNGVVLPNANVVYNAVGSSVTAAGVVDTAPANDKEWAVIADSAAALVESGNLLLMSGRAVDNADWITMTRAFMTAAQTSLTAAQDKKADAIFATGGDLNETCDRCHERYQRR